MVFLLLAMFLGPTLRFVFDLAVRLLQQP
jgi:hypothetical protein